MLKKYLPVLQKGLVSAELEVFPFGYEWIIIGNINIDR
jgi:hypothetical protein